MCVEKECKFIIYIKNIVFFIVYKIIILRIFSSFAEYKKIYFLSDNGYQLF